MARLAAIALRPARMDFVSIHSYYSLAGLDIERELLPAIEDQKLGLLCWSPLAGGLLSGKFDRNGVAEAHSRGALIQFPPVDSEKAFDIIDVLTDIGAQHGVSAAQVALAWILARPFVTSVITGVKRVEQLTDNLAALDLVLSEDDKKRLYEVSWPAISYPGWIQTYNAAGRFPAGHPFGGQSWTLDQTPL
ncbi:aldo/keto reductase [Robbsia andropogonis]|uniref:aldo/keto reductase n=1 Tax=Robbsia andropogonis TaxID=28092 RepID=UPI0004AF5EE4|nr:aldo/keto reductase [Robbsia andropogonis]